jgi:hypothetical protein
VLVLVGVAGLALAGFGLRAQLKPRTFTSAQQKRIEAWEVARRWRTTPKATLFPRHITYKLGRKAAGKGALELLATRLDIAPQATCSAGAGSSKLTSVLRRDGCATVLRSTYADSTSSLVVTAGITVLTSGGHARDAAEFLTGGSAGGQGRKARQVVLRPFRVFGTAAASFGFAQRQLTWAVTAGPYLVLTTVGYADGRPRVPIKGDSYADQEMKSLARGVAARIAAPLAAPPHVPRCPGDPAC